MTAIRHSTARTILVGQVLKADGTFKDDEVVGSIKITKNGTVGAAHGSTTLTHDHTGKYKLAMNAGDPDTVGVLEISLNSGTNDMQVVKLNVIEEAVYDAMYVVNAAGPLQSTTAGRKLTVSANGKISLADGAQGGSSTVLTLSQLVISGSHAGGTVDIDNSGGAGLNIDSSVTDGVVIGAGGGGDGVSIGGHGAGAGLYIAGGDSGQGILIAKGLFVDTVDVSSTTTLTVAVTMPAGLAANITGNLSGSVGSVASGVALTAAGQLQVAQILW